jgi:hypothetical protein
MASHPCTREYMIAHVAEVWQRMGGSSKPSGYQFMDMDSGVARPQATGVLAWMLRRRVGRPQAIAATSKSSDQRPRETE